MDLRQLRYFESVLEEGTFTAAAARCHVAQPALWAQVRALEDEWELPLFERVGRRVRPTAAALALRPLVRVVLGDVAGIDAEVQRLRTGDSGVVRIGTTPYQLGYFLAEALARYARRAPDAAPPVVVPIATADPYAALAEGAVDLVSGTDPQGRGFPSLPLYRVWLAAVGQGLPSGDLELTALRDRPLALFPRAFGSRAVLEAELARARLKPRVLFESDHTESLLALAREGLAIAVLVNEALPADLPACRLLVKGRPIAFELSLMWRSEATLTPAARRLRDVIAELASERRDSPRVSRPGPGAPPGRGGGGRRRRSPGRGR